MTEKDILIACCGTDADGITNSIVKVQNTILDINKDAEDIKSEVTLDNPSVNIMRTYRYTIVDLIFINDTDYDYINTVQMLRDFIIPENSMDAEDSLVPAIVVTISPKSFEGQYYVAGMHGTWCLMPSDPSGPVNTIRFIFDNELLHTYELNDADVDYDTIATEMQLEAEYGVTFE